MGRKSQAHLLKQAVKGNHAADTQTSCGLTESDRGARHLGIRLAARADRYPDEEQALAHLWCCPIRTRTARLAPGHSRRLHLSG